jgi:hypothetical protein
MTLAFITGGATAGRDGVGDYLRVLCGELAKRGHECSLLALNDPFVPQGALVESHSFKVLQIAPSESWGNKLRLAGPYLEKSSWVSVQFVSYAYDPRGLAFGVTPWLMRMTEGKPTHCMMHELWLGNDAPLKKRLLGVVQKFSIRRMLRKIAPKVVHTSNMKYCTKLRAAGFHAEVLPLFGSIPVSNRAHFSAVLTEALQERGLSREEVWLGVMFGTLHLEWPPEPLLSSLDKESRRRKKRLVILSLGRLGRGEILWESMVKEFSSIHLIRLGEQPAEEIANTFASADFGIATTPLSILGKSGTAAAMLEHGLPMIVNRVDTSATETDSGVVLLDDHFSEKIKQVSRRPAKSRLPAVIDQFVRSLEVRS